MARCEKSKNNQGFTLLETLIAFIVLVFGLLGAVARQTKAKQASFDAMQRAAALALAHDITERIKSNTAAGLAGNYTVNISSQDAASNAKSCINAYCNNVELAGYDIEEWRKAIKAQNNTGALSDATVCVNAAAVGADQLNIGVTVTWESRQEMTGTADVNAALGACGGASNKRRLFALTTYTYVRS